MGEGVNGKTKFGDDVTKQQKTTPGTSCGSTLKRNEKLSMISC